MKYSHPFTLLSLSTAMTLAAAAGSYAQANPSSSTAKRTATQINIPSDSIDRTTSDIASAQTPPALVAKTVLPSRAKQTIPLNWLKRNPTGPIAKAASISTPTVAQSQTELPFKAKTLQLAQAETIPETPATQPETTIPTDSIGGDALTETTPAITSPTLETPSVKVPSSEIPATVETPVEAPSSQRESELESENLTTPFSSTPIVPTKTDT
ncbi:hypothetical protein IQ266_19980, partial [filamentous cyanobacterium LEGE 11480]